MPRLTAKRIRGNFGEEAAAKHLKKSGYRILERNFSALGCEIDLIVQNREFIVFVEVKSRRLLPQAETVFTKPASAVDREKQKHLILAAKAYLAYHPSIGRKCRFDVVEVYLDPASPEDRLLSVHHIQGAFTA